MIRYMFDSDDLVAHERFYPENNDRMPAFAADRDNPGNNLLSDEQIGQIVDWMRVEAAP